MKFGRDFYLIGTLSVIGIILIFALSWQTDSNLKSFPFMPAWIYDWADTRRFHKIRTAVPFVVLSLLIGIWFCKINASIYQFIATWIILTGVVVLAEFGQYFIPTRYVEPKDIFWGAAGSFLGLASTYVLLRFLRFFR